MSKMTWIIVLVILGIGAAILIGVLGTRNEPAEAQASGLCSSLTALQASLKSLTNLDPTTASKSDYQSDLDAVRSAWNQVQGDSQDVKNAPMESLDNAGNAFESAVRNVPNDASVSDAIGDVTQSADQLVAAAQSTAASIHCT